MIITNKKSFMRGIVLLASFAVVFLLILSPIFPGEKGKVVGLEYADYLFNRLSKGSSWFVPAITPAVSKFEGKEINITISIKNADNAAPIAAIFAKHGVSATAQNGKVSIKGDLGTLLKSALLDCDNAYHNNPDPIAKLYGVDGYTALALWWGGLQPMIKELQKEKHIAEAQIVDTVLRKGIEPAYNFRGIPAARVSDEGLIMAGLLAFYVLYTLWYGFAIFDLFEGIGLTMKKGKKAEA